MAADTLIRHLIRWPKTYIFALINMELINMIRWVISSELVWNGSLTESLIFSIEGSHRVARKFTSSKVLAAVDLCRRRRLANRRIGRGIGEEVEELWCETHTVRRRCLSKPMTNLLSPFEGVDEGESREREREEIGGENRVFKPSIPFLARLERCHVKINCFTRLWNIVTWNIRITRRSSGTHFVASGLIHTHPCM